MPSTHLRRLSDYIKAFARSSTSNLQAVEIELVSSDFKTAAAATITETVVLYADGPVAVQAITFVPSIAATASGTLFATITLYSRNAAGTGQVTLATRTTATVGFTAFLAEDLYAPATELVLSKGQTVTFAVAKASTGTALDGTIFVQFVPLLEG